MQIRICTKCNVGKPLHEFYAKSSGSLGLSARCKKCDKAYQYNRRITHPKIMRENDRRSRENNKEAKRLSSYNWRQNNKERVSDNKKTWAKNNPDKILMSLREWAKSNPEKTKARAVLNRVIRRGEIPRIKTQQCNRCNNQAQNYHHWSYKEEHWLDVEALCKKCHYVADQERQQIESLSPDKAKEKQCIIPQYA